MSKTTCSTCSKTVYRGPQSRPEIVCHECRRAQPRSWIGGDTRRTNPRPCPECDQLFAPSFSEQVCCSRTCDQKIRVRKRGYVGRQPRPVRICSVCGEQYHPTGGKQKTCSMQCGKPRTRPWPSCRIYFLTCRICECTTV